MSANRKICVVTGSRAEYGLLNGLMKEIASDPDLQLQVVATGTHLSPEFGLTYNEIESDGFRIDEKVEMLESADTAVGVTKSIGRGVIGMADAFARLKPDIVVVLGDRFEILAAVQAAMVAKIPVAHISGGETTEGAFDESIRHAITKMSHLHFVMAGPYRQRVVQMGESPDRVFNFGAPGLDQLETMEWMSRGELEKSLAMKLGSPLLLVTYHPATLGKRDPLAALDELLRSLDSFTDATVVITYPNADPSGRAMIPQIEKWVASKSGRAGGFVSLGQKRYLSLMREADVVIGNSSSAITEAPALKKASVNIGDRQKGRIAATSVINSGETSKEITAAITRALSAEHRAGLPATKSHFGSGNANVRIKEVLKTSKLDVQKPFYDLPEKS